MNPVTILLGCLFLPVAGVMRAAGTATGDVPRTPADDLNVRGVFTSDLPGVGRSHSLRLILHPHFGDLIKYDHFRTDLGLKYAVSDRWELSSAVASYFSHGLGNAPLFDRFGVGSIYLRTKYRLGAHGLPGWDSAVGGGIAFPINHPPLDVTDGLDHLNLFATFARPWRERPDVRVFWGVAADFVRESSTPGRLDDNELRDHNQTLSGGFILDRGALHYTFEARMSSTRLLGRTDEEVFEVRPGIIWEFGREDSGARKRWLLGVGVSTTYGPDGFEYGLGGRLRLDLDLKRWWRGRDRSR